MPKQKLTKPEERKVIELEAQVDKLYNLVGLKKIIAQLSAKFISLSIDEIDQYIGQALNEISQYLGIERSVLIEFSGTGSGSAISYSFREKGIVKASELSVKNELPLFYSILSQGELYYFERIDELPDNAVHERQYCESSGIKSNFSVPLNISGRVIGFLGFSTLNYIKSWTPEEVRNLKLISHVIANALARRNAHFALKSEEEKFSLVADNAPILLSHIDTRFRYEYLNKHFKRLLGIDPDTATGHTIGEIFGRHTEANIKRAVMMLPKQSPATFENELMHNSGHSIYTYGQVIPDVNNQHNITGYYLIEMDITMLKKTEKELKQSVLELSDERFKLFEAQRISHLGHWDWDLETNGLKWSDEIYRIFGLKPQEFEATYDAFLLRVHPDDRDKVVKAVDSAIKHNEPYNIDHRIILPGGSERIVHEQASIKRNREGRAVHMLGTVQDITRLKHIQLRLKEANDEISRLNEKLASENLYLKKDIKLSRHHTNIIGESEAIKKVLSLIEQVANSDTTVLIQGETGVGKELVANAIHIMSKRKDRAMVIVNCASLPASLIESELFGHEKGAFTGAYSRLAGRFEIANDSTILLDEIGELPLEMQVKLLRIIQEGTFQRIGSTKTYHTNARILASTNRDLAPAVNEGRFRQDLYYRLNVFPVYVPPLRERKEDISLLVTSFIDEFNTSMRKNVGSIPKKSLEKLTQYAWPGNIRELRNVIERSMILSYGKSLQLSFMEDTSRKPGKFISLDEMQRLHIMKAMELSGGKISGPDGAADILGENPTTLRSRMDRLKIHYKKS